MKSAPENATPVQDVESVPSAGDSLESLAWLVHNLEPVVSKDVMARLLGVREFVRWVHAMGWDRHSDGLGGAGALLP